MTSHENANPCTYFIRKGEIGEEAVAKELAIAAMDPRSPLSNDSILRSVVLPGASADRNRGALAPSEADFVVMTDSCVFVIEAKNRAVHVNVSSDASTARLYDAAGEPVDGDPVAQNARHAELVRRICKVYPAERVFNISAFVNPLSLGGRVGEFVGNRAVVALPELVGLLEQKQAELRSYLTNDWLEPVVATMQSFAAPKDWLYAQAKAA